MLLLTGCMKKENKEDAEPIRVAVIDTGFSTRAIPTEQISEGKNYVIAGGSTEDTYGHGTAVASVILDSVADPESVQLIPLVSSCYEDGRITQVDSETLAQMIRDAVDVYDCRMINISAGLTKDNEEIREAVRYADEQNVFIVAAAGNDYAQNGSVTYYPAAYDTVLAVGSCTEAGEISSFSQRGEWVDVYEVGENVTVKTLSGNTRTDEGTSYSAAKITAKAVNLIAEQGDISVEKLTIKNSP